MWLRGSDATVLARMNHDIETATAHLHSAGVDLLVYACTGGSMINGPGHDLALAARISEQAGGIPTITTTTAILAGLHRLGLERLVVLAPYQPDMTEILGAFLASPGFEVRHLAGRNHTSNREIGADRIEDIVAFAVENDRAEADGFFMSCTNWRAMAAAAKIEWLTGKPVVTANQATIWLAWQKLGLDATVPGYGRLLENCNPANSAHL